MSPLFLLFVIRLTESGFIFEPKMNNFPKNIDKIVTLCYTLGENHNRGAADMINTERDFAPCGKGEAAEDEGAARARSSGHVGNTGVTVTFTVVCYWISERTRGI